MVSSGSVVCDMAMLGMLEFFMAWFALGFGKQSLGGVRYGELRQGLLRLALWLAPARCGAVMRGVVRRYMACSMALPAMAG